MASNLIRRESHYCGHCSHDKQAHEGTLGILIPDRVSHKTIKDKLKKVVELMEEAWHTIITGIHKAQS